MKFEYTDVWGFEHALRGMRNPKNSWNRSDSHYVLKGVSPTQNFTPEFVIGPNDLKLAKALISGGSEHRKFLRQIFVSVDITAPFYFWKEWDTYKVATVANSCSTMHKILSEPITDEMFEDCDYEGKLEIISGTRVDDFRFNLINTLEALRCKAIEYDKNGDKELSKKYWKELIRWLPEGWLQKRTVTLNYETIYSMIKQRKNHKLVEWHKFIEWAEALPNMNVLFDLGDNQQPEQVGNCKALARSLDGKKLICCNSEERPECKFKGNYKNCKEFGFKKCDSYCEETYCIQSTGECVEKRTVCNGTRERDECSCGGNKFKCDFYQYDPTTDKLK